MQYYKHFKLRVWDVTPNSLKVDRYSKLVKHLGTLFKAKVQPSLVNKTEILMENIPDKLKAESLEFFEQNKDKLEGVDLCNH